MAKHRHRSYEGNDMRSRRPIGSVNNNPFGINPQQLLSMLGGNMDMSGLGNLLASMNKNGFDLNSLNNLNNNNSTNNSTNNSDNSTNNNKKSNHIPHKEESGEEKNLKPVEDENIQFLESLRKIVDMNKIEFIDRIIELYNKGAFKDIFE